MKSVRIALRLTILTVAAVVCLVSVRDAQAQFIVEPPPGPGRDGPGLAQVSVSRYQVDAVIDGPVAMVTVTQEFRNPTRRLIEGRFLFPLPTDAAISDLQMTVDGQVIEGTLLDSKEARAIYASIVRRQRDPALLEYIGQGLYQTSVFPIPPGDARTLTFTYVLPLVQEGTLWRFVHPLGSGGLRDPRVGTLTVNVDLRGQPDLRTVYSASHPIDLLRQGDDGARIVYTAQDAHLDQDFELYFGTSDQAIDARLLSHQPTLEDGYFLLLLTPEIQATSTEIVARDLILILDVSGSMDGEKMTQAKAAAHYVVNQLNPGDRFNLITFSTQTSSWRRQLTAVDAAAAQELHDWIDATRATGSTDINRALLAALAQLDPWRTRPAYLLFLTDGLPTQGVVESEQILHNVAQNRPHARSLRLFTFGVGYDVNTALLDTLSQDLGGRSSYVLPDERIDETISHFYDGVSLPVLTNAQLTFALAPAAGSGDDRPGSELIVEEVYPSPLPDLFAGEQLVVAGRYRTGSRVAGDGALPVLLRLTGEVNGERRTYAYEDLSLNVADGPAFVARLWATRKIGSLLETIRRNGPDPEVVDAIVDLSLRYGVTTPYTAYLVTEPATEPLRQAQRPGGSADAVGLRAERAVAGAAQYDLGASATGADAVMASIERSELQQAVRPQQEANVRVVGGKVFVPATVVLPEARTPDLWVDSAYATEMGLTLVEFGSDRYFALAADPQVAAWLAVSSELIVVLEDGTALRVTADAALLAER